MELTYKQKLEKLNDYFKRYKYNEEEKQFIVDSLTNNRMCDIVLQVYSECGILKDEDNIYLEFIKNLKRYFTLDKDIIDVGGGLYPALATYINKEQIKLKRGSITVFDPLLIPSKLKNIVLKKEEFTENTRVEKCDLIIGTYPCEATIPIIKNARKNNKEFSIALCGCTHFSKEYLNTIPFYMSQYIPKLWNEHVMDEVYKNLPNDMEIKIDYFENPIHQYPIITKKYK